MLTDAILISYLKSGTADPKTGSQAPQGLLQVTLLALVSSILSLLLKRVEGKKPAQGQVGKGNWQ